jgi:oxygen-independent coproporphyrinogen-3 oxidase
VKHLYIHIPFCTRRCAYCDFNTYANMEHRIAAYVAALCDELRQLAAFSPPLPVSPAARALRPTIFFGGGTPTLLSVAQFEQILTAASALVPLDGAEITSEANPGSEIDRAYLRDLRSIGVNRLSMGVQSLHDPTLRILGRTHDADAAYASFNDARAVGFDSINLDFIFGLPGQDQAQWEQTLATITTWGVDHFSLYSLIVEESTPLYAQVTTGRVQVPDSDATAAMYEAAISAFASANYVQYEISNWAVADQAPFSSQLSALSSQLSPYPRHACQHNLAYWLNSDYLAAGAGAHGHLYPQRYANILGIDAYIAAVQAGQRPVAETTPLAARDLAAETMFMGLRLNSGVSEAHVAARCGITLDAAYGPALHELLQLGLIERIAGWVRLTPRGRMLGNRVFEYFV